MVQIASGGQSKLPMTAQNLEPYLTATPIVESDHPAVVAYAHQHAAATGDDVDRAVKLYFAVRDGIRYDPYHIDLSVEGLKATTTLETKRGWCVQKSVLLAACCRVHGIPARLGFADVRNHLSTARLRERLKTDTFYWHSYTSILLNGEWLKATPAFNIELCEKFRLHPLDFNGREDSIYHPFDLDGNQHMEYLAFRGEYADVPIAEIAATFDEFYEVPHTNLDTADFDKDVEQEVREQ